MLNKEHHKKVVNWTKANVARDFKMQSLRNALLITVSGDREKAAMWRLDKCEVGRQARSAGHPGADELRRRAGMGRRGSAQGVQEPPPQPRAARRRTQRPLGKLPWTLQKPKSAMVSTMMTTRPNQRRLPSVPSWPTTCTREAAGEGHVQLSCWKGAFRP